MKKCMRNCKTIGVSLLLGMTMLLSGCGAKKEQQPVSLSTPISMNSPADIQLVNTEGKVVSYLTGEWVDPEVNGRRPVAIMINNIGEAMPQSGIGQADIIYEMVVEGGITRLMAVFSDYQDMGKIGPVRSARQYYVRAAGQLDAVFCHIGTSTLADNELASGRVDNMDGMNAVGNYFIYRDDSRVAPHNAYTSGQGLNAALEYAGIDMNYDDNFQASFSFNSKNKVLENGSPANKVTTAFNGSRQPWFEYHEEDHQYYRFQFGEKQIDDQTGEQLKFQNVLILFAETYSVDGYLMEVCNADQGDGYYATNGQYIPITWRYELGTIHYYTKDGERLRMNPGKTWITYFDKDNPAGVMFE